MALDIRVGEFDFYRRTIDNNRILKTCILSPSNLKVTPNETRGKTR